MNECINKIDTSLLQINVIKEYLEKLNNYKLISFDYNLDNGKVKFLFPYNMLEINYLDFILC